MEPCNTKFDIIIQGGQSNANGSGVGPVKEELAIPVLEKVYYLESQKLVEDLEDCVRVTYEDKPFCICAAAERGDAQNPVGDFSPYRKFRFLVKEKKNRSSPNIC